MNKQQFFEMMDSDAVCFPETDEQVEWFKEWEEMHPEIKEANEQAYRELTERQASEYMCMKFLHGHSLKTTERELFLP